MSQQVSEFRVDLAAKKAKVLVVSDVRLYREGLAAILTGTQRVNVVTALPGPGLSSYLSSESVPDVVLLDLQSPRARECLTMFGSNTRVIAVAVSESEDEILALASAGLSGFVGKDASAEDIVVAIDSALRGEMPCPPRLVRMLFHRLVELVQPQANWRGSAGLTSRELEVMEFLEQGCSNKEIACHLNIGVATVKNHIHNILEKLHVHRRGEAAAALRRVPRVYPRLGAAFEGEGV